MTRLVTTRKCGCNAFGRVCLSVCLCVCLVRTFGRLDLESLFSYSGIYSEYLGQIHTSRSSGQSRGHRSKTPYIWQGKSVKCALFPTVKTAYLPQNRDLCRNVAAKAQDCDRADWRFLIEHIFLNKMTYSTLLANECWQNTLCCLDYDVNNRARALESTKGLLRYPNVYELWSTNGWNPDWSFYPPSLFRFVPVHRTPSLRH